MQPLSRLLSIACAGVALTTGLRAQVSDNFYALFPSRVQTLVKASYDPDDREIAPNQGNDDGFSGANFCEAYRYSDNGTPVSVLAHFEGRAGVLGLFFRNFWSDSYGVPALPGENNRTRMWVDGAVAHDLPLFDFFRNPDGRLRQVAPFDGPFTVHRSGAHMTSAQIRWQDSFRLTLDDDQYSNSARFHRVAATLASPEGDLPMPDKARWETIAGNRGSWPHLAQRVPQFARLSVAPNGGRSGVTIAGPGTILELTFAVVHAADWEHLWARFTFDNAAQPQVSVPLRHLGGMPEAPASYPVKSLLFSNDGDTELSCWFPMPFLQSAQIEVENRGPQQVDLRLWHCEDSGGPETNFGYFVATNHREITGTGEPFLGPHLTDCRGLLRGLILEDFADTSGRIPNMHMTHLEGDLCVRINGNRGDDHTFAASETSIGRWGWYITPADKPFDSDTSFQSSLMARFLPSGHIEGRRIQGSTYLFDPVHFVDGIEIVLEHGVQNTSNADYSLTAFFYVQPGAARHTIAEIDIGNINAFDPTSEPNHNVQFVATSTYWRSGSFLRDQFFGTAPHGGLVRRIRDYLRFDVQRPANTAADHGFAIGLRLDRTGGPQTGPCQADVYVNGQHAGLLHVFTHNPVFPWKEGGECEVALPKALTDGLAAFTVELRPRPSSHALQVERVWVYQYTR